VATYIVVIIGVAFIFDFINGFHDSANSIATVVGTRVLTPLVAVAWAATFNFLAAFTVGTAVAKTVGKGMIDVNIVTPNVILAGLLGAIIWNLITWYYGLPSSSSHALVGGYAGAAVAKAGWMAIIPAGWIKTLIFIVASPLIGAAAGYFLMVAFYWIFRWFTPAKVDRIFRRMQLASAALFSLSHGANDAQKTMGIIVGLLISAQGVFATETGWMRHLHRPTRTTFRSGWRWVLTPRSRSVRCSAGGASFTQWGVGSRSSVRLVDAPQRPAAPLRS
jgi:PiT family inorganic phosphate transporter